nr:MAG TPA: hypothetical protein [Caudoviricetes sp.]
MYLLSIRRILPCLAGFVNHVLTMLPSSIHTSSKFILAISLVFHPLPS